MIILGIDPGTATTGCGVIKVVGKGKPTMISYEKVVTEAGNEMTGRLLKLHTNLTAVIKHHKPDVIAVERLFFNTNVKTAMTVGQARGVIMLVAAQNKLPFYEYTALQAKSILIWVKRLNLTTAPTLWPWPFAIGLNPPSRSCLRKRRLRNPPLLKRN
ncbi:MAG: crossover junction endodeoxyribonuclease RuvC [candidate division WWE3 bacterium]|nr:crossover junction endodeoxyribonuclease RuvC [candidate division WWE3 bacterium]